MDSKTLPWSPWKRVLFRFAFCYFGLYCFPSPQASVPGTGWLYGLWEGLVARVVPWFGARFLGLGGDLVDPDSGSGDTAFRWLQMAMILAISVLATVVWSLLERRKTDGGFLYEAFRVYLRYGLAFSLLSYGLAKFVPGGQFSAPNASRLLQPFGDATPMGLLWTFMGHSSGYTWLCGLVELLAGVLLLFRRTTLLGALLGAVAMGNIAALNFFYDVPVKAFSSHLFLICLVLILPDAGRLAKLFLFNAPVEPAAEAPPPYAPGLRRLARWTPILFLVAWAGTEVRDAAGSVTPPSDTSGDPLTGIWEVEELSWREKPDGEEAAWRRVVIPKRNAFAIQLMDDTMRRYFTQYDTERRSIHVTPRDAPKEDSTLAFQQTDPDHLVLEGPLRGHFLIARLKRTPPPKFRLLSRGFRWVTEYPDNY